MRPVRVSFEERHARVALALTPGVRPRRILRAVERCGCVANVMHLPLTQLEARELPARAAQAISSGEAARAADQELEKLTATGARC
jgi:DNA processing protein